MIDTSRTIRLNDVRAAADQIRRDPALVDSIDSAVDKALAEVGAELNADERRFLLHELVYPTPAASLRPIVNDPEEEDDVIAGYASEF